MHYFDGNGGLLGDLIFVLHALFSFSYALSTTPMLDNLINYQNISRKISWVSNRSIDLTMSYQLMSLPWSLVFLCPLRISPIMGLFEKSKAIIAEKRSYAFHFENKAIIEPP